MLQAARGLILTISWVVSHPISGEALSLEAPLPVRLYWDLQAMGLQLPYCPLYREEVLEVLCPY